MLEITAQSGNFKTKANFYKLTSVFCTIQIFPPVLTTELKKTIQPGRIYGDPEQKVVKNK